ncbi:hypothetical protein GCM10011514_23740 [Emticicia aquatilis]|uniref:Uncharacterized protein n=1 Tax=Emticicia aquatilis TaxID=1537369 RepID=A0A917DPN2_9BACT|nr:hypothetical protein [Emticicia aquatilis]GGD59016.1 hypothetical protein GCM10011514_23740 [Emticicia aquatilis]
MIEVFKTDIRNKTTAKAILKILKQSFPSENFNFDLNDCDKILRTECNDNISQQIIEVINNQGFRCEILEE